MRFPVIPLLFLIVSAQAQAPADSEALWGLLRQAAAAAPLVELTKDPANPRFAPIRLNAPGIELGNRTYGVVRIQVPPGEKRPLVWMFSEVENIDEYEIMPVKGGDPIRGNYRVIYPALGRLDEELERRKVRTTLKLPKPWDLLDLHLHGVPGDLLLPGEEYIIWFRFADRQPADVLMAAMFLEPSVKLVPEALPGLMGLPEI